MSLVRQLKSFLASVEKIKPFNSIRDLLDNTRLVEYYLIGGYIYNETFDCKSLGNHGCFDGVCFKVSLSFDNSEVCLNQQVTATI